jgi:hypothetical protein
MKIDSKMGSLENDIPAVAFKGSQLPNLKAAVKFFPTKN